MDNFNKFIQMNEIRCYKILCNIQTKKIEFEKLKNIIRETKKNNSKDKVQIS